MTLSEFASSRGVNYNTLNQYLWRHQDLRALLTRNETGALVVEPGTKAWEWLDKKYPDPSSVAVLTHHPDDLELISDLRRQLSEAAQTAAHLSAANDRLSIATERLTAQLAVTAPDPSGLLTMQAELKKAKSAAREAEEAKKAAEDNLRKAEDTLGTEKAAREASEASLSKLTAKYEQLLAEHEKTVTEVSEASAKLQKLKARGFWARIRNKDV